MLTLENFETKWSVFEESMVLDLNNRLKENAPVKTGNLRDNIVVTYDVDGLIISGVSYMGFVEFGTIFQSPNPFIRTTLASEMNDVFKDNVGNLQ